MNDVYEILMECNSASLEPCHEKMCPKIFVVAIPKEGMTPIIKLHSSAFKDYIL